MTIVVGVATCRVERKEERHQRGRKKTIHGDSMSSDLTPLMVNW